MVGCSMAVINSFVNVIAGATVLLGGEPFMDKRIGDGAWTVRKVVGIPLLAVGGIGILVGYLRNRRVRGKTNDAESLSDEPTCASCGEEVKEEDIIGDGTNRGLCCVPGYYDDTTWFAETFNAEKWKPKPQCEECGAFEGGNIDGCDDCDFTYWFNGKVYHPDSMIYIGAETFEAETSRFNEKLWRKEYTTEGDFVDLMEVKKGTGRGLVLLRNRNGIVDGPSYWDSSPPAIEWIEDILGNSDWELITADQLGALSEAPVLAKGHYDDEGNFVLNSNVAYYFGNYQIEDWGEVLDREGEVFFHRASFSKAAESFAADCGTGYVDDGTRFSYLFKGCGEPNADTERTVSGNKITYCQGCIDGQDSIDYTSLEGDYLE